MKSQDRREFLRRLALATGSVVVLPMAVSCTKSAENGPVPAESAAPITEGGGVELLETVIVEVPMIRPEGWDPVVFNANRGNAGAIPEGYLGKINGPDGVAKHLGKHLPFVPNVDSGLVPAGFMALMWGNPEMGYARHPQAPEGSENYPLGHFYNWIRVRKAVEGETEEVESVFTAWPGPTEGDSGLFVGADGGDITADGGRNTVYLVRMPSDVAAGDTVRIYGHCLYHGEYVDFVTV